eukprot:gene29603-39253_t
MRFTSLIVELIRARPRLMFWVVVLFQAALWVIVPLLLYSAPPGDVATVLAFGREYQVGTDLGPPLAFWLADIAYRAAGNHVFGVYVLAQLCFIATFNAQYLLARNIVGGPQAVIAVLLTLTVTAFSSPGVAFGPDVLARPLFALVLLHGWQVIGQGRRNAWFALSIEAGLLLLTTRHAPWLLLLPVAFGLCTARGRRNLASFDPLFALLVIVALVLPWVIWVVRADMALLPALPRIDDPVAMLSAWGWLIAGLVLAIAGVLLLTVLNWGRMVRKAEDAPIIYRPAVDPLARQYVYFFAVAPGLLGSLLAALYGYGEVLGGAGIALLMTGLAVVVATGDVIYLRRQLLLRKVWAAAIVAPAAVVFVATLILPWLGGGEQRTALPASEMGRFFGESFERRTSRPLQAVSGDPELAALIGMSKSRPHLLGHSSTARTPWITPETFNERGGVVVWRAADTIGTPPDDIAKRFPGLVPELQQALDRQPWPVPLKERLLASFFDTADWMRNQPG